ncbi:UNVERIFIED_CONTAM: hypothetical protein GTU68_026728 [Idotea baltica]|nr:hypothetical protein [Idotea baltica]
MQCRPNCGACCIAPSINSPIPGMPNGKPAGVRCVQLDANNSCKLFGLDERPPLCSAFQADSSVCGESSQQALTLIQTLELATL